MSRFPVPALVPLLVLAACAAEPAAPAPVGKGAVVREELLGAHTCRATGGSDATFRWEFRESGFTIARDGQPIPPEVLSAVAARTADAARIEGRWELAAGALALSDLRAVADDGRAEPAPDVTLAPFRTPVVRFELAGTQYVLGPAR